ncbi:MAG: hypothetical protein KatS3mg014_1097 [Actinomycetota bacterium]|nr:MAG: hypothetical protein KatS3mg014_1097 [Actinomycetota bacterium]
MTVVSLALCVLGLPQARAGIVVNLVLLVLLFVPALRGLASAP